MNKDNEGNVLFSAKLNRVFRYDRPTQVKFLDIDVEDEVFWQGGIAYGTEIICGCCGGVFEIADIYADWNEVKDDPMYADIENPIQEYHDWVDLREYILGDDACQSKS